MSHPYADIIHMPHHQSTKRPHMSLHDRAAQFAPFAALSGYDAAIEETARATDQRIVLNDAEAEQLSEQIRFLIHLLHLQPVVQVVYFVPDKRKSGGAYETYTGALRRIDPVEGTLCFLEDKVIRLEDVLSMNGEIFHTGEQTGVYIE